MLDLITIFSAAGLQQELKNANGEKSLVIREDDEESDSFMESAAHQISAALDTVDGAVSQGFEAIFGKAEEVKAKKLMD
eukprot:Skav230543  [mRNA]  locus=scaffold1183:524446:525695:- [translate_table: standard]